MAIDFFHKLPYGIIVTVLALRVLQKDETTNKGQTFDIFGGLTLFISLISLLLALSEGKEKGWGSSFIISLFISSIVFFIIFVRIETSVKQPVLDLYHFKNRQFAAANISALISLSL